MANIDSKKFDLRVRDHDIELLARLRLGDAAAFEELVQDNIGRMLSVVLRFVENQEDAHDIVQEAFLSAFKAIGKFDGNSRISTWLHRIAVNAALMRLRSKKSKKEQSIDDLLPAFENDGHQSNPCPRWSESAESVMARKEARSHIQECISRLPADYREVLQLRDIEEFSSEEAAELLGITVSAVKTRLHRARQALRTLLEPYVMGDKS